MASKVIDDDRVRKLNSSGRSSGDYVLYWMQQSQRAECNHALEFAIRRANDADQRLLVCFGIDENYPGANLRHFRFMIEGLQETADSLKRRGVPLVVRFGRPSEVAMELGKDAAEIICDRGYLRHQREWRQQVADASDVTVWQVEADAIVPVEVASEKAEYAARTIRPKLHDVADRYLTPLATTPLANDSLNLKRDGVDLSDLDEVLSRLSVDETVQPVKSFEGGTLAAKRRLKTFLEDSLDDYSDRTAIVDDHASHLSPYLHFGQISPLAVALAVQESKRADDDEKESFVEELLVRRELALNFVTFHDEYDSLNCLPEWASETLEEHRDDNRPHHYTATELENAQTHDVAWNASMLEMIHHGYIHNHLRMYWGKKIIEWTNTPEYAHQVALELNNKYFIDGRDPNSYANIAWLFGMHDRAHQERDIFGKVRYMSFDGLKRKFDVDAYVRHVAKTFDVDIKGFDKAED